MFRLIIADDEAIIRCGLTNNVNWSSLGFSVVGAFCCGNDVIRFLNDNAADALLTDIRMEEGSGMELAQWVNQHRPDMQIILLTGYVDYETARQAVSCGVVRCLLNKPVPIDELKSAFSALACELEQKAQREEERRQMHLACLHLVIAGEEKAELLWQSASLACVAVRIDNVSAPEAPLLASAHSAALFEGSSTTVGDAALLLYPCRQRQVQEVTRLVEAWLALQPDGLEAIFHIHHCAESLHAWLAGLRGDTLHSEAQSSIVDATNLYLDQHQADRIYLADMAAWLHYSPSHFSRIFQKSAGMSFAAYVLRKKLQYACEMLGNSDASIAEVAAAVGFVDARHFAHSFKRTLGLTPSQYKHRQIRR